MDGELITAIAAVAVSVVGAGYAARQAQIAKSAARSAEAQVKAAEEQVALMLRQVEGEEVGRHEARGPEFTTESGHTDISDANVPRGVLVLRQASGPALSTGTVTATGEGVEGMRGKRNDASHWGYDRETNIDIGPMASGGTETVHVDLDFDTRKTKIVLHLTCRAQDGTGTWQRSVAAEIEPRPRPRASWV